MLPLGWSCLPSALSLSAAVLLSAVFLALIIQQRRLQRERDALRQEIDVMFSFIHDVSDVFAAGDNVDLDLLLKRVLFYALRTTRAGAGAIHLLDGDGEFLQARAVAGLFPPLLGGAETGLDRAFSKSQHIENMVRRERIRKGEGLVGTVADFGTPALIEDAERDPRVPRYQQDFLRVRSILLVPMRFHQRVLGVLTVVNRVDGLPFAQSDLNLLQAVADQASVSVHYAGLRATLDEKQRLDHDLGVARRIQTALLPTELPRVPGVEIAAFNTPALEIGGDYYDFIPVDEQHLGIAIADVSGKGIGGAIMMSICRSVLRAQSPTSPSPMHVLRALNRVVRSDITEDMFVSVLYMVLNTATCELAIARAGHERPLLCAGGRGDLTAVESPGIAIGICDTRTFDRVLGETTVRLQPGDVVVAYTDGITEALNAAGEEWGVDRLREAVKVAAGEGANSVLNNVRQRLARFVGNRPQYDDMTLLALRVMR